MPQSQVAETGVRSASYRRELGNSTGITLSILAHLTLASYFPFFPTAWPWSLRTVGKYRIVPFHCPGAADIKSKLQRRCGTFTWHFQPTVSQAHRGIMSALPSLQFQPLSQHRLVGPAECDPTPGRGTAMGTVPSGPLWSQPVPVWCLPAGIHRGWSQSFRTGTDMLLLSCTIPKAVSVAPKMDFTVVY